jgi:hypothetical protein
VRVGDCLGDFLGQLLSLGPLQLGHLGGRLVTQAASAPVLTDLLAPLVEVGLHLKKLLFKKSSVKK